MGPEQEVEKILKTLKGLLVYTANFILKWTLFKSFLFFLFLKFAYAERERDYAHKVTRLEQKLATTTEQRAQYQKQIDHINNHIVIVNKRIAKNDERIETLQHKAQRLN